MTDQATTKRNPMHDLTARIIAYEACELDEEQTVQLFQDLLDTEVIYRLQGFYHRAAQQLIDAGLCTLPPA